MVDGGDVLTRALGPVVEERDPDGEPLTARCEGHRVVQLLQRLADEADDVRELTDDLADRAIAWMLEEHRHGGGCDLCLDCYPEPDEGREILP